jgi:single-stranded DNA-binding protein
VLRFLLWRLLAVLAILTSYTLVGWFLRGGPGRLLRGSAAPSPLRALGALASAPVDLAGAVAGWVPWRPLTGLSLLALATAALAVARCVARRRRRYVRLGVRAYRADRGDADGERRERPHYFDVSAYGATAESVARFLHKGSRVGVDGKLDWREWETAENERRQNVSVTADLVQFLDAPGGARGADDGEGSGADGELDDGELAGVGTEELEVTF